MAMVRFATLATCAFLSVHALRTDALSANPEAGVYSTTRDNTGFISAPVRYQETMLIAVTSDGVAAIVFDVKDAKLVNKSARYRYRYLKDATSKEVSGTGIVLDSVNDLDALTIKAGQIRLGWSGGGHDRGWIYYKPEETQLSVVSADRFNDTVEQDVNARLPVKKLDLKRFLKNSD